MTDPDGPAETPRCYRNPPIEHRFRKGMPFSHPPLTPWPLAAYLVAFHAMQKHEWIESMALLPTLRSKNQNPADPFAAFRRELDSIIADYNRALPTLAEVGARIPALNIAETKDAIEITTELPGVDEKDINVSLDDNRLVISGEKKQESDRTDKEWHVVERSYGAFHRAIALPFEPNEASIEAHFDKGVLHLKVKKPAEVEKAKKTIEIKAGPPESPAAKTA